MTLGLHGTNHTELNRAAELLPEDIDPVLWEKFLNIYTSSLTHVKLKIIESENREVPYGNLILQGLNIIKKALEVKDVKLQTLRNMLNSMGTDNEKEFDNDLTFAALWVDNSMGMYLKYWVNFIESRRPKLLTSIMTNEKSQLLNLIGYTDGVSNAKLYPNVQNQLDVIVNTINKINLKLLPETKKENINPAFNEMLKVIQIKVLDDMEGKVQEFIKNAQVQVDGKLIHHTLEEDKDFLKHIVTEGKSGPATKLKHLFNSSLLSLFKFKGIFMSIRTIVIIVLRVVVAFISMIIKTIIDIFFYIFTALLIFFKSRYDNARRYMDN